MKLHPKKCPSSTSHFDGREDLDSLLIRLNTEIPLPEISPFELFDQTENSEPPFNNHAYPQTAWATACFCLSFCLTLIFTVFFLQNLNTSLLPTTFIAFSALGIIPSGIWFVISDATPLEANNATTAH